MIRFCYVMGLVIGLLVVAGGCGADWHPSPLRSDALTPAQVQWKDPCEGKLNRRARFDNAWGWTANDAQSGQTAFWPEAMQDAARAGSHGWWILVPCSKLGVYQ